MLNKLDLRLDAIEHAIHLPITFKSGQIYELRIHVPWTKLGNWRLRFAFTAGSNLWQVVWSQKTDGRSGKLGETTIRSGLQIRQLKVTKDVSACRQVLVEYDAQNGFFCSGSEPVVITINTIECIIKLKDSAASSDTDSTSASTSAPSRSEIFQHQRHSLTKKFGPKFTNNWNFEKIASLRGQQLSQNNI